MINSQVLADLGISPEGYNNLSDSERKVVDQVLLDIANGDNELYEELYYSDYDEVPVDFITFISDDRYLGKSTRNGQFLYPFWKQEDVKIIKAIDTQGISEVALSGCLAGDTVIPLIDGRRVTIKELAESEEKNFKVYSYDLDTNRFTVGTAVKAFSTGYKMTYNVTFDNGNTIRITGNHKFLTRDKHYKSIDDGLSVGDSIMPYYFSCLGAECLSEVVVLINSITLDDIEEVYDIEVERYHNFALEAGVVVHNSIGVGKTVNAVLLGVYHLYRTMCMKDPQAFFGLAPGSRIDYAFLNNTLSSSYGVAYSTFQAFIQESPWFLKHGKIVGRSYPEYVPEKGFGFIVGSKPQHSLGKHVICLTGDTVIRTTEGDYKIEDLEGKTIKVYNYSFEEDKDIISDECTVVHTTDTEELIEIELEDNTFIRCTPFHRLMLKDGSYKMAKDLTEDDELMDI